MLRNLNLFFTAACVVFSSLPVMSQNTVSGEYHDNWGRRLIFRSDSTYRFETGADTWRSWCEGIWTQRGDTIFTRPVAIMDTMLVHCYKGYVDSIFFSVNSKPERFRGKCLEYNICRQDTEYVPSCFLLDKDKLYWIAPTGIIANKSKYRWERYERTQLPKAEPIEVPAPFTGRYTCTDGSEYTFHSDSTFDYSWHGHMTWHWATGHWLIYKDTLYLFPDIPVDTIGLFDVRDLPYDSVFLSPNEFAERITDSTKKESNYAGFHSPDMINPKLWIHNDRLYLILADGMIDYEKRADVFYGHRYKDYTYYTKSKE